MECADSHTALAWRNAPRRPHRHPCRRGFTLVELLIVVGIIGFLAAAAIPTFQRYQLRARATASMTHLQAIAVVEDAYYSEFGTYVSVSTPVPATLPAAQRIPWPAGTSFELLGFAPEGAVQFQYAVAADSGGGSGALLRFTAEATSDLDSNGEQSFFAYVKPGPGVGGLDGILPGSTCVGTGVIGAAGTPSVLSTPGPCDVFSGRSRF